MLFGAYFLLDLLDVLLVHPEEVFGLLFTAGWSVLLAAIALLLPRLGGQIFFGITYTMFLAWSLTQSGYYAVFNKLMWVQDLFYIGEGVGFLGDTLGAFPASWWIGGVLLIGLGVLIVWKFPATEAGFKPRLPLICAAVAAVVALFVLPMTVFFRDNRNLEESGQTSSYRMIYDGMYDAQRVYDICGLYHMTVRDIWTHQIYPKTPAYAKTVKTKTDEIRDYFASRKQHQDNAMTGIFKDKNVVLVLMESMDDWTITQEDTPTLHKLMAEGINFTDFYTPGFGTARTLNTEFCINTGIYLPTTGDYVFDYLPTNSFDQSLASLAVKNGYSAEVFHYNEPTFYSRGIMEPAIGYDAYNSFMDHVTEGNEAQIYDENMLFDVPALQERFFREGPTLNTIITRSAHLGYDYNEKLSQYALERYPEYRGRYGSEEEDCIRVKAKLVDDMFARLLTELEKNGQLENTVIIGVSDHYAYGFTDTEELMRLSGEEYTVMMERTPFFVWSADAQAMEVDKTLNTSDFLPTVLNLLGIESPYHYLGQDAFDPSYDGYALFPDGTWISDGVACRFSTNGDTNIICNKNGRELTEEYLSRMAQIVQEYIYVSNLLLSCDYYGAK